LANRYLLFEQDEGAADRISFETLDRGIFPPDAVRTAAPVLPPTAMTDAIDRRRVRGLIVHLLESAVAGEGHTLLPRTWLVQRALSARLEPKCAADEDILAMAGTFLDAVVRSEKPQAMKLKRYETAKSMIASAVRRRVSGRQQPEALRANAQSSRHSRSERSNRCAYIS
jgi:hypothetical protein